MGVLAATANPMNPEEVEVSRPTDALEAREAADDTFTALFLGLGAVALFVGGVGIANVMVISVLERRSEIGLRRAIGATKGHIAVQFLGEALLLSLIGGVAGVAIGYGVTMAWAAYKDWEVLVPQVAVVRWVGGRVDNREPGRFLPGDPCFQNVADGGPSLCLTILRDRPAGSQGSQDRLR